MNLAQIGEFGLIASLQNELKTRTGTRLGIGDDCAVLEALQTPIVTLDALVEGVHFRRDWTSPRALGRKAMAVSVSDLAASGARPVAAFVSLCLGARDDVEFIRALYRGFEDAAQEFDFTVAGGDTTRSKGDLVLSITLIGEVLDARRGPILRSGAQVGDQLWVTGTLGDAAAGLAILQAGDEVQSGDDAPAKASNQVEADNEVKNGDDAPVKASNQGNADNEAPKGADAPAHSEQSGDNAPANNAPANNAQSGAETPRISSTHGDTDSYLINRAPQLSPATRDYLLERHHEPTPRLEWMKRLLELDASAVHAALDLSDGLVGDAAHLARRSGVRVEIEADLLPISSPCHEAAQILGFEALDWALSGGEDYELLLAIAPDKAHWLAEKAREAGVALTLIGQCMAPIAGAEMGVVVRQNGELRSPGRAWTHF